MPSMASRRESSPRGELPVLVFEPGDGGRPRAGIVLFHGGALRTGSADALTPHCRELAARGIFAVSAGYRLLGRGATSIDDCLADVRQALEHFGRLAASRGIEASRLAAGGSSAGAHLALLATMTATAGSPVAAVVALNPAGVDLRSLRPEARRRLERQVGIAEGGLLAYSLVEHVRPGLPRTLIHHGTHDEVEPVETVRRFRDVMVGSGNECTLLEYEHAAHGFHYPDNGEHFDEVIAATTRFLCR